MGCLNNSLLINITRTCVFFILLFIVLVNSDFTLIDTLCGKTHEPNVCGDCLNADPRAPSANSSGLAEIALECAERDTTHLHEDTAFLASNSSGNLRIALDTCASNSLMAQQDFDTLKNFVREGFNKSAAIVLTRKTIPQITSCLKAFDKFPDMPVPPDAIVGTDSSNKSTRNAADILAFI